MASSGAAAARCRGPIATVVVSWLLLALLAGVGSETLRAQGNRSGPDLMNMSLEDLLAIKVTSVSKKEQKLSETPAAIYVITQEEIRRSGATNVPDILRTVPGLGVAQLDGNIWAIGTRGSTNASATKCW